MRLLGLVARLERAMRQRVGVAFGARPRERWLLPHLPCTEPIWNLPLRPGLSVLV